MPATQISFAAFALAQQAALSTPPVLQTAVEVVAHPLVVDGGECPVLPSRDFLPVEYGKPWHHEMREEFFDPGLNGLWFDCLDAPEYLPAGGFRAFAPDREVLRDGWSARRG